MRVISLISVLALITTSYSYGSVKKPSPIIQDKPQTVPGGPVYNQNQPQILPPHNPGKSPHIVVGNAQTLPAKIPDGLSHHINGGSVVQKHPQVVPGGPVHNQNQPQILPPAHSSQGGKSPFISVGNAHTLPAKLPAKSPFINVGNAHTLPAKLPVNSPYSRPFVGPRPVVRPHKHTRPFKLTSGTYKQTRPFVRPNKQTRPFLRPNTYKQTRPFVRPSPHKQTRPYVRPRPLVRPSYNSYKSPVSSYGR